MEYAARKELGMSSEEFYNCTWYDWGLWVHRINELRKREKDNQELLIEMFRSSLMYINNWKGGKAEKTDFWRLSYDTEPQIEEKKQLQEETIKRLERIAKKRKRG